MRFHSIVLHSPVVYGWALTKGTKILTDFKTWSKYNYEMLSICSELWVLKLDGWELSVGVTQEIKWAKELGLIIKYVSL